MSKVNTLCENCEKHIYNPMGKWIHVLNDEEGCKHVGDYNKATPEKISVCEHCEKEIKYKVYKAQWMHKSLYKECYPNQNIYSFATPSNKKLKSKLIIFQAKDLLRLFE